MQKYTDNPGLLFGKRIDFKGCDVTVKDTTTGEIDVITCGSNEEARTTWADLQNMKFAIGINKKDTKYRQWFAFENEGKVSSHSTGWTKTS